MENSQSYKDLYNERKEKLLALLNKTASFLIENGKTQEGNALVHIAEVTKEGKFSIMVTGQFSTGKSTFLNALMGEAILPSFSEETTAAINYLHSVDESPTGKPAVRINFRDGKQEISNDISEKTINKYACTKSDLNVVNEIESVELFLDSKFLNDGVFLVDSPGLNGTAKGHADLTKEELRKTHASIFMFSAEVPGPKTDFEILHEMKNQSDSIIFVLNKIDAIRSSENETPESLIKSIQGHYKEKFPNETLPEIWPIDSYQALVARSKEKLKYEDKFHESTEERNKLLERSRFEKFEERLMRYLTQGEKAKQELMSPLDHIGKTLTAFKNELQTALEYRNNEISSEDIQKRIDELTYEQEALEKSISSKKKDIKKSIRILKENTGEGIKARTSEIENKYIRRLEQNDDDLEELELKAQEVVRQIEREMNSAIICELENFEKKYKELITEKFESYTDELDDKINKRLNLDNLRIKSIILDHSKFEIDAELDDYMEKRRQLRNKLYDTQDKLEETEWQHSESVYKEQEIARLKTEEENARNDFNFAQSKLGVKPGIVQRSKYVINEDKGILTKIKEFFVGDGGNKYTVAYYDDDSDQKNWEIDKQRIESEYANRISNIQERRKELGNFKKSYETEAARRSLERKIERLREEEEELEKERQRVIAKERHKKVNQAKLYLDGCFENYYKEFRALVIEKLDSEEKEINQIASDIIKGGMETALLSKKDEYLILKKKKEDTIEENERQKDIISLQLKDLQSLLEDFLTLKFEINSIETDKIERS